MTGSPVGSFELGDELVGVLLALLAGAGDLVQADGELTHLRLERRLPAAASTGLLPGVLSGLRRAEQSPWQQLRSLTTTHDAHNKASRKPQHTLCIDTSVAAG